MKKFKYFLCFVIVLNFGLLNFVLANTAMADPKSAKESGYGLDTTLNNTVDSAGNEIELADSLKKESPENLIGGIIGVLLSFVGVLFFILLFIGGLKWMFAQGNEQDVEKAKQLIIAALTGLIIVLSAYAITAFVGQVLIN